MRAPSYHNTTDSSGAELGGYETKAWSQDEKILGHFKACPTLSLSPSHIRAALFLDDVPLTSIRRAMSNLTAAGDLTKTDEQKKGPYGRPEYLWRLADKHSQGSLF